MNAQHVNIGNNHKFASDSINKIYFDTYSSPRYVNRDETLARDKILSLNELQSNMKKKVLLAGHKNKSFDKSDYSATGTSDTLSISLSELNIEASKEEEKSVSLKNYPQIINKDSFQDECDLSSLGSDDETDHNVSFNSVNSSRSIFRKYWDKSKNTAYMKQEDSFTTDATTTTTISRRSQECDMTQDLNKSFYSLQKQDSRRKDQEGDSIYEETIKEYEEGRTAAPLESYLNDYQNLSLHDDVNVEQIPRTSLLKNSSLNARRRIFKHIPETIYHAKTSVQSYGYTSSFIRKAQSTSALIARKRQRSCLRPRSFSLPEQMKDSSPSIHQSVSFDPKVSIHEFDKAHNIYAKDGWSKYFH
mmetsp:Transcript_16430/g.23374  ORF Transcript_16430/g.23374 Transcript_16430/m.23374 type:complete len:360 (+) Transcript_16430:101-1180(+)